MGPVKPRANGNVANGVTLFAGAGTDLDFEGDYTIYDAMIGVRVAW
jgi:hypothetical protein